MEEENNNYIEINWIGGESERVDADTIGAYEEIQGMMIAFKNGSDLPIGFYNTAFIKSIKVVSDE